LSADEELRLYRTVLETSGELIWSLDREGRWTSLNAPAARRIYGREAADLLGRPFTEVVARELRERDYAVFQRLLDGQSLFDHETRHMRSDGALVDLSFNAVALRDADMWERAAGKLASHLDGDGLLKYFPLMQQGSDALTAYVLSVADEAGYQVPAYQKGRMLDALAAFVEGRIVRGSACYGPPA